LSRSASVNCPVPAPISRTAPPASSPHRSATCLTKAPDNRGQPASYCSTRSPKANAFERSVLALIRPLDREQRDGTGAVITCGQPMVQVRFRDDDTHTFTRAERGQIQQIATSTAVRVRCQIPLPQTVSLLVAASDDVLPTGDNAFAEPSGAIDWSVDPQRGVAAVADAHLSAASPTKPSMPPDSPHCPSRAATPGCSTSQSTRAWPRLSPVTSPASRALVRLRPRPGSGLAGRTPEDPNSTRRRTPSLEVPPPRRARMDHLPHRHLADRPVQSQRRPNSSRPRPHPSRPRIGISRGPGRQFTVSIDHT
jgi:hypothetical protein